MAHLIFLPLINLNHCVIEVVYSCIYTLGLAEPCCHMEHFQHLWIQIQLISCSFVCRYHEHFQHGTLSTLMARGGWSAPEFAGEARRSSGVAGRNPGSLGAEKVG